MERAQLAGGHLWSSWQKQDSNQQLSDSLLNLCHNVQKLRQLTESGQTVGSSQRRLFCSKDFLYIEN